jgi:hypothetical protein
MTQYIKTIGYEAPSYVIEKFLEVQNLELLIEYLERLIETPITKNNNLLGNNKDYTALLLNCYLKLQKKDKIEEQMIKDRGSDSIFDVETAIDVCRMKLEIYGVMHVWSLSLSLVTICSILSHERTTQKKKTILPI